MLIIVYYNISYCIDGNIL